MKKLYEIQSEHQAILDQFDNLFVNGEPTQEELDAMNDLLAINSQEFEAKAEAYAAVIAQKKSRAEFLEKEAKKLKAMADSELNQAERLRSRIEWAMKEQGLDKVELPHFKLRFSKSESVKIVDQSLLPAEFIRTSILREPNKTAIKEAIKAGNPVAGAEIETKQSLVVK